MGTPQMDGDLLLSHALQLGRRLLENGAEIYRVEESIERICLAYGAERAEVYAVPTSIIATIDQNGHVFTQVCRIRTRGTNLDKVHRLNALCRSVCAQPIEQADFAMRLELIDRTPGYSLPACVVASGGVAAFFALLFAGTPRDAMLAFAIGVVLELINEAARRLHMNILLNNALGGIWIGAAALAGVGVGALSGYDAVIVGSIMPLVPGLLMTNSLRDMMAGDFMAGITRFSEALLYAASIAVGVALPLALHDFLGVMW